MTPELTDALRQLARAPSILVGCDYDGTIAPIVDDPTHAAPLPESVVALRALAGLSHTTVAVVSGRSLRDLATLSRLPGEIHLVGSHGSEFDADFLSDLEPALAQRLREVTAVIDGMVAGTPGVLIEHKPASVAVHLRRCSSGDSTRLATRLLTGPATLPGVFVTYGKAVLEFAVVRMDKGHAFQALRAGHGAAAALFIGDDVTDESVFECLSGPDLSIKVGPGETAAAHRVDDPIDAARVFATLAEERRTWLAGADSTPIEDHGLLSDGTTLALLTPNGRIAWFCHPGVDAPAVFAELLGGETAGHLTITPVSDTPPLSQTYVPDTMTIATRWAGVTVTDYLDRSDAPAHAATTATATTRLIRAVHARVPVRIIFAPRPEFGQVAVRLEVTADGVRVMGGAEPIVLRCPEATWEISHDGVHETAIGTLMPTAQLREFTVELRTGTDDLSMHRLPESQRRTLTEDHWRDWVARLSVPEHHHEHVTRSALTLKALCQERTGAILAAATTSLPEGLGGVRNWDYRYCWLRDAALAAQVLVALGSTEEAQAFLLWLHIVIAGAAAPERVHPLYTVHGTPLGSEAVVDVLPGYAGSRPVRVGNAAQGQVQLDVFGPIVDLIADLVRVRGRATEDDLWLTRACVGAVTSRWREPDHGIWEIRDRPRHHVHSKAMCWLAVMRGIEVMESVGQPQPDWVALRDEIAADVLEHGWYEPLQSFVCAYDRPELDAAALHVALTGLLPHDDPRLVSTVEAVEAALRVGPTVLRYLYDDGLPGREGGMTICTTWLIECYLRAGLRDEAEELLRQVLDCSGRTGLLSEQWDPNRGRGLGNHPQAYSHIGVIRAALALDGIFLSAR